jgi:DNA transformation protein
MPAHGILPDVMADHSFKDFVLDQLSGLPELRAKAMFGGHGLYQADCFFGILMEGRLYFKTDERTRPAYLKRGMGPFIYEKARRITTIHYFEVPPDVLENREDLVAWAHLAIQAAAARSIEPAKKLKRSKRTPR